MPVSETHLEKKAFWRTLSAAIGIWVLAVLGTAFVYDLFLKTRKEIVGAEVATFRDAFVVVQDIQRLHAVLDDITFTGAVTAEHVEEGLAALDFLYVRNEGFRSRAQREPTKSEVVSKLSTAIGRLVIAADSVFSTPNDQISERIPSLVLQIDAVNRELLLFVDEQYFSQARAIIRQGDTLKNMTISAVGLFWVMSVVATGAVLLYRRSLLAQARRLKAEEKANYLAYFDPMTGMPNRTRFRSAAEQVFRSSDDPLMLILDLDGFKAINDTFGHAAGDAALIHAANCIAHVIAANDGTAARLGGDEFAAVVPGPVSSMRAAAICEQILSDCAEPFETEGASLTIGLSIGIAFRRSVVEPTDDLIAATQKAADIALYRAKADGKRTYAFFDADLADMVERRRSIELGIEDALRNDGFSLAFQPQIDLSNGQVKGFEALCRWTREGEAISPGEFISVAEATGQVVDIDIWGLRHALRTLASWIEQGLMPVTIAANLSPLHFRNDTIVEIVRDVLRETGLPPSLVTLEITESILIDDMSTVTSVLERLRNLGVRLALDDFGTGYSSLAYLRRLNVDYIKIDQSFMRDLEPGSETGVILESLVSLAQGLGKKLVVEGVETEDQAGIVTALGCDVAQGYLFGRPLPEDEARARLPNVDEALARPA